MHKKLDKIIKRGFRLIGLDVYKYDKVLPNMWTNIEEYQILYEEIKERTVVTQPRCFMLYQLAKHANNITGEIAEVGVYKGGTGKLISKTCPKKTVHLFDTFSGMPTVSEDIDILKTGDFSDTSLESVQDFLKNCNNIAYHPGFFPETADAIKDRSFCLVYIDVDIYQSVKDCLKFFYNRVVPGGVIVFDDYEHKSTPGVKKAINEFLMNKKETPIITARHQCMILKI